MVWSQDFSYINQTLSYDFSTGAQACDISWRVTWTIVLKLAGEKQYIMSVAYCVVVFVAVVCWSAVGCRGIGFV